MKQREDASLKAENDAGFVMRVDILYVYVVQQLRKLFCNRHAP